MSLLKKISYAKFDLPFELNKSTFVTLNNSEVKKRSTLKFDNRNGQSYSLNFDLRDLIKPGWQSMFRPYSEENYRKSLKKRYKQSTKRLGQILDIVKLSNSTLDNKVILDIGCNDGLDSFMLATTHAKKVIGTDITDYYINQCNDVQNKKTKSLKILLNQRQLISNLFNTKKRFSLDDKVEFIFDDITHSTLNDNSVDLICSWDTIEHINDVDKAFSEMYRILKPGGLMIHEYNPFFAINGGHSLCTLDFLWGHVLLDEVDFSNYIKKYRPNEFETAFSFYKEGLNRISLSNIYNILGKYDFNYIHVLPEISKKQLKLINDRMYCELKKNFPNAEIIDLISPKVHIYIIK
jgi:SAM-dependent methyltransferase